MATFVKTTWIDNSDPAITAAQLNRIEAGIYDAVYKWSSGTLAARPPASAAQQNHGYFATDDNGGTAYICFDGAAWTKIAPGVSALGGHTIKDEGVALTARAGLNFVGAGVTVTDDAANNQSVVTIPGGGGGSGGPAWAYDADVSAASFVDITGLNGDTDIDYEIVLDGVVAVGGVARNITARPNNLVASTENTYAADNRTGLNVSVGNYDSNGFFIAYTTTNDSILAARGTLFAKSGRVRKWLSNATVSPSASAAATIVMEDGGRWDDTTTNITSLRLDFGGGTFTGRVRVRKLDAGGGVGLNVVRGSVNADGTIRAGSGFTVARLAVGDYRVTFSSAFASVAVVNITAYTGGAALSMVKLYATEPPTATTFRAIAFRLSDGNSQDSAFDFTALPSGAT